MEINSRMKTSCEATYRARPSGSLMHFTRIHGVPCNYNLKFIFILEARHLYILIKDAFSISRAALKPLGPRCRDLLIFSRIRSTKILKLIMDYDSHRGAGNGDANTLIEISEQKRKITIRLRTRRRCADLDF